MCACIHVCVGVSTCVCVHTWVCVCEYVCVCALEACHWNTYPLGIRGMSLEYLPIGD